MEKILASGPSNDDVSKHVFLVKWKDYTHEENTWETFENVAENAEGLFKDYYQQNVNVERDKRVGKEKIRQQDTGSAKKKS
jgi:hypothetical protein